MANGISITVEEFSKLPQAQQNAVLFENLLSIKNMFKESGETFSNHEKKDWMHQRMTYIAIFVLAVVSGIQKFILPFLL